MRWQASLAGVLALGVLLAVGTWHAVGRGTVALGQVVDICPECSTGSVRAARPWNLDRVLARAPRGRGGAAARRGRVQQLSSLPEMQNSMMARTQMLPYKVSGDLTLPRSSAMTNPVQQVANPDLMIRFTNSRVEQPGVIPPEVPREIYDDAQSTKRMAAHLKAVLRQQKGIAGETKAKVDKLRQFIAEQTERLVQEADNMDADDTKLIDEHARTEGPPGPRGEDGTPGTPGTQGENGANGVTGDTGAEGSRGLQGGEGEAGPPGPSGGSGKQGLRGPAGPPGPPGVRGPVGPEGAEPGSVWYQSQQNPELSSFNPALCPNGDNGLVRLAQCTHRSCKLEVLHEKHWGSVCDDGFGQENARVVCMSLGYSGHRAASLRQLTGGSGKIWLDDVKCMGNEESITLCAHNGWGLHDCTHHKDVGVCCQRRRI